MSSLLFEKAHIEYLVHQCLLTHEEILELLKFQKGDQRGLSLRSLERFCSANGITKRSGVSDEELREIVSASIEEVGPYYGYRTLKGHIEYRYANHVSKHRIAAAQRDIDPINAAARLTGAYQRLNPKRYFAPYFGYNLHIDQNEKLVDYGVTVIAAIDGYSSYILNVIVMPVKNNLAIYRDLLIPIIKTFGLFRRIIVDGGMEFLLTLFMQQFVWSLVEPSVDVAATYRQTKSTKNNRIERWWVEHNQRIAYPIKTALVEMEAFGLLDVDIPHHLYSSSYIAMSLTKHGATLAMNAWNHHHVRKRGVPVNLIQNSGTTWVPEDFILNVDDAVRLYNESGGGILTSESYAGTDLLGENMELQERRQSIFLETLMPQVGDVAYVFGRLVNGDYRPFQQLVLMHVQLSEEMAAGITDDRTM